MGFADDRVLTQLQALADIRCREAFIPQLSKSGDAFVCPGAAAHSHHLRNVLCPAPFRKVLPPGRGKGSPQGDGGVASCRPHRVEGHLIDPQGQFKDYRLYCCKDPVSRWVSDNEAIDPTAHSAVFRARNAVQPGSKPGRLNASARARRSRSKPASAGSPWVGFASTAFQPLQNLNHSSGWSEAT